MMFPVGTMYGQGSLPRYIYAHESAKTRGPVLGGQFGPFRTVMLMDADHIDEFFLKQGNKASGRLGIINDAVGNALMSVPPFSESRELFRSNTANFKLFRGVFEPVDDVGEGYGIAGADGERWRRSRRLAWTSLFTTDRLQKFSGLLEGEVENLIDYISKLGSAGVAFDPVNVFSNYTLRIISSMAFGKPLGHYEEGGSEEMMTTNYINTIFEFMSAKYLRERIFKPLRKLPWAGYPNFLATTKKLWAMLDELVTESEQRNQSGASGHVFSERLPTFIAYPRNF